MYSKMFLLLSLIVWTPLVSEDSTTTKYAIVVSEKTAEDWKEVVHALKTKHNGRVIVYKANVGESLKRLKLLFPRYTCFVAKKEEAGRAFVAEVHRLTRKYDNDPYTDTYWGILTGFDKANALSIAKQHESLVVERVAGGTQFAIDKCVEGLWYDELVKGKKVQKKKGGKAVETIGVADSTKALVDSLNEYKPDLFITSGHATERDWQIGFRYRNGYFKSRSGEMIGEDTKNKKFKINSPNPKVYMAVGNCLMGHIDGPDAMALAWLKSAGVHQMLGYTVPTWYGYGGWGCLDYFVEQPGRYSFTEAFFANHHALIHRLQTYFPSIASSDVKPGQSAKSGTVEPNKIGLRASDGSGLSHDRDVVAYYGDPAWVAKMSEAKRSFEQVLSEKEGVFIFEIKPQLAERSFDPVDTNGSQRGYRPIVELLPFRLKDIKILEGHELKPIVMDDFILIPNPRKCDPKKKYIIKFSATKIK